MRALLMTAKDNHPVYEYSYTFQWKTTAEIQQEFSILTGTLQVNSDGVTWSSNTDCRIKKDIPSLASATKIEITATTVVNSNRPTHNASYAGIWTWSWWWTWQAIYCVEGSGYNWLYVYFGSLWNVVGTAWIWTYTPTITIDLENKEIIGTLSGYSNSTKTLSDADVATIRAFTYLVVYVSTNNSAVSDVNIKIYGSIPNNLLNNNLSLNQNINQNNNLENNLHVRPPVNNGSGDLQKF